MDIEKVKKGLKCCLTLDSPCGDCPYYSYEVIQELDCERNLRNDAIDLLKEQDEWLHKKQHDIDRLCNEISEWKHKFHDKSLKEQEAVEPIPFYTETGEESPNYFICGHCKSIKAIMPKYTKQKYCHECGFPVLWEGR